MAIRADSGPKSLRCFQHAEDPGNFVQIERAGHRIRTVRLQGDETESDRFEHFTDRHVALQQFDARVASLVEQGWAEADTRAPRVQRRRAASSAFALSALWASLCFCFGLLEVGRSPEAAVLVFLVAPGSIVPALLGAVGGAGPSRWSSGVLALLIIATLGWAVVSNPTLEATHVGAFAALSFFVSLLSAYCFLELRRWRRLRRSAQSS
jgi:hypothetical protein